MDATWWNGDDQRGDDFDAADDPDEDGAPEPEPEFTEQDLRDWEESERDLREGW